MSDKLTIADLDRTLYRLAVIIEEFGDTYLPIYERVEREREEMLSRQRALDRVAERVKSGPPDREARS